MDVPETATRPPIEALILAGRSLGMRWGRLYTTPFFFVSRRRPEIRIELTIYPPGTTVGESRRLHFMGYLVSWYGISFGILISVLAGIFLTAMTDDPLIAVLAGGAMYVMIALGVATMIMRPVRKAAKESIVLRSSLMESDYLGDLAGLLEIAQRLDQLDAGPRRSSVEYELTWGFIYDEARNMKEARR